MHRLKDSQHARRVRVRRVLGHLEAHLHVALRAQVVYLRRPYRADEPDEALAVGQVAVVQAHAPVLVHVLKRVLKVQVLDASRVEARRAPDDAVHLVALPQQQLRQERPVLPRYARDERDVLCHDCGLLYVGVMMLYRKYDDSAWRYVVCAK